MWKHQETTNLLTRLFLLFVLAGHLFEWARALSDKRLCSDENCKEIISLGTGTINYPAGEEGMVSFKMNSVMRIKSKSAGRDPSLWGVEVNGREGYAPKRFIRETNVYVSENNLKFIVDVEQISKKPVLTTSEKLVEQESALETTTTKPLNVTPTETSNSILNKTLNEEITAETLPAATPVSSVNGTNVPTLEIEGHDIEKSLEHKAPSSENNADVKEESKQDKIETEINSKTDGKNEENLKQDKNDKEDSSETSKEPTNVNEFNEIKQHGNNEEQNTQTNNGNAFKNETNIPKPKNTEASEKNRKQDKNDKEESSETSKEPTNVNDFNEIKQHGMNEKENTFPQTNNENAFKNETNIPKPKNTEASEKNLKQDKNDKEESSETSKEPTNVNEFNEIKQHGMNEKENTFTETNNENAFKKETNIPKPKNTEASEENLKQDKSETSKEQTKVNEFKAETANKEIKEEIANNEKAFKNETNISNPNKTETNVRKNEVHQEKTVTKDIEVEAKKPQDNIRPVEDVSTSNEAFVAKKQVANVPDDVRSETTITETVQHNTDSLGNQTINENPQSNDAVEENIEQVKEIYNTTKLDTEKSAISTHEQLSMNKVNLNNTSMENQIKTHVNETDNFIFEKEHHHNQTYNESPLQTTNNDKQAIVRDTNDFPAAKKADMSSDKDTIVTDPVLEGISNSSSEANVVPSNDKLPANEENIVNSVEKQDEAVSEKIITKEKYYITEAEQNKINDNQVEAEEKAANDASYSNSTNENVENLKDLNKLVQFSSIGNNNSLNAHNQQESNNEVSTEVPLQQSKVDNINKTDNINSFPTEVMPYDKETAKIEPTNSEPVTEVSSDGVETITSGSVQSNDKDFASTIYQTDVEVENINPTTHNPNDETVLNTPLQSKNDFTYQDHRSASASAMPNENHLSHFEHSQENLHSTDHNNNELTSTVKSNNVHHDEIKNEQPKVLPTLENLEPKENKGLFATIMGTVNNMLSNNKKKPNGFEGDNELDRILFTPENVNEINNIENSENSFPYCKNIGPNGDCPEPFEKHDHSASHLHHDSSNPLLFGSDITLDDFLKTLASKIIELSEMLAFLVIAAAASLFFVFGYYCFCKSSREGALLLKLNQLESSLLASHKESAILKHNLMSTRQKLASIEDNSFGSNDMVVSLKKELEEELLEKARLKEQVTVLQKELENAADAGIELNKIVSELLSNQTGDESIISSVEELQKQLNEQQNTIYEINASLAEKSRENSELQLMIAEQNARYETELANVQRDNDELEHEKGNLLTRLEEMKSDFDKDITAALEGKNFEIKRLQNEMFELSNKLENEHTKWQTSVAKIEALEECLKSVRRDPKVNITEVIDVANVKAQLIEIQKKYKSLKEKLETELDSKKLAESQLEIVSAEVAKLKQDFNESEKDKLEAQTRLEVLSNYFKDKENQLQKELSLKEAMWLKQQGETTTTVDRLTAMQEEIQSLKSQNDSLRAEIEAQAAAHKAQTGTLENRAHETWLAARQSDRRYDEARAEATALRRKLTALAGGNVNESKLSAGPAPLGDELTQAPSPIHMESPGSPMLGRMPPPPFLPPPFMGPPPPFMGMPPPPPFVPPGEMRPAPLGRIMSPPPQRSGRFSPQHLAYEDYIDYESNNTWNRHTYSPPPRTYRSLSPADSRYNYGTERDLISTYDTETDFSPPPSPRDSRRRIGNSSERIDSNTKISYGNTKKFNSSNKAPFSSGSEKSFNTHLHSDTKTKKTVGGKNLV